MKIYEIINEAINFDLTLQNFKNKIEIRKKSDHAAHDMSPEDILSKIISSDPTPNQKYVLKWLLPRYLSGGIRFIEDLSRAKTALTIFDKNKSNMNIKDIQQVENLSDLEDMVEPFVDTKSQNELKKEEKEEIYNETKFIYKGPEGILLSPLTERSSCFWGKGTKWCTAATTSDNMFNAYNNRGPLYIVIMPDGKKYQFHLETGSFMDEKDKEVNWKSISFFVFKATSIMDDSEKEDLITNFDAEFIRYIEHPSRKLLKFAITNDPYVIKFFDNLPYDLQKYAVSIYGMAIRYIKNPSEELQKAAIDNMVHSYQFIENPSEEITLYALNKNGSIIRYIDNPSEEFKLAAVINDGKVIKFIKNPSEKVQLAAVRKNWYNIEYIKNPTEKVKDYAMKNRSTPNHYDK